MSANFGFAVAKVQQNLQVCKKNRIFLCFFARRVIASALDRWQGTGKVLDGNGVATEWYQSDNEVVSRKIAGKKHIEDRRMIGHSQVNNSVILRISYVYVTYILRN